MNTRDLVLVDGYRTPMIDYNGDFAEISAIDLGAIAARALIERTGADPSEIDIPATVTIPANETSVTFEINAVDDGELDGTQSVQITASMPPIKV